MRLSIGRRSDMTQNNCGLFSGDKATTVFLTWNQRKGMGFRVNNKIHQGYLSTFQRLLLLKVIITEHLLPYTGMVSVAFCVIVENLKETSHCSSCLLVLIFMEH